MNNHFCILAFDNPLSHVIQHPLFRIHLGSYEFVFSNHMLMMLLASILMIIIFPLIARREGMVPHGLHNFFESILVIIREEVVRPMLGERTDKYITYLWTVFFFILFNNLLGMIPLTSIIWAISLGKVKNLGGTATANIWVTGTLAIMSFILIHISGIREQGLWHYIRNFIPRVPIPLIPVMYVLEFISALVKPFALAIRLFANMLAGHTIMGAFLGLIFMAHNYIIGGLTITGCAALSLLELLVAFVQAYIFTFLTTMFIATAVQPEH
ncbi:MAG: F0F1 ATP synthase subunit A [Sedimentisphaerales bacterium]|nr:F0F1 ATP synthase subunit A [Sedimentisphaerales bacterium]